MPLPMPKFSDGQLWDGTTPHSQPTTDVFKHADGEIAGRHSSEIIALEDLLKDVFDAIDIISSPGTGNSVLGVKGDASGLEYKDLVEGAGITITHATGNITIASPGSTTDEKVGVDSGATAGYIGAAANDGVIRIDAPLTYVDGGDFVTLGLNQAAVDHGTLDGLTDDDHIQYLRADGTRVLAGDWNLASYNLSNPGLIGGVNVPTANSFFNGTFQETFNALVTSDGATVTLSLEQSGTGDLTMQFSDGYTTLDCTAPVQTITLTAGVDDTSPQANYIYIPQSTKVLTKSTSTWPAGEHIRVAYCLVPSATFVQSNGCYINQNWNDHLAGTDSQGHMAHMSEKLRRLGATWFSGVNANGATASYFTIGVNTVDWLSTFGEVDQLHEHTFPAVETSGSDIVLVVNQYGTAYDDITDLYSITDDNTGTTIQSNRYFNLVFWGVVNKSGEFAALMVNLPGGFYTKQSDALIDSDGHDVYDIPREFSIDSGTVFLICRATFKMGSTWTHISTTDLRGLTPATASGSSVNDHGGLGGLTDDDHAQYLLADGTRSLSGNMTVAANVTIDGRDLSVDGVKLDGIEALADVTDATNVGAAGAAMSGGAFHDGFSDHVADEHIDWKSTTENFSTSGTVTGINVTSGVDPGHTHTGDVSIASVAGENLSEGDVLYVQSDSEAYKAKADADATSLVVGLCDRDASENGAIGIIPVGSLDITGWGLTAGDSYYLSSSTAGEVTNTAPTTSGEYVVPLGIALSTTEMAINIQVRVLL